MDKATLIFYLEQLDDALDEPATLVVYGSATCILLDEPARTSLDIDIAGPYSTGSMADLRRAADVAGIPLNPDELYAGDHLEWVQQPRLSLPPPDPESDLILWQGSRLILKTVSIPKLIASKLIRYDETDQADIEYLVRLGNIAFSDVEEAASSLPPAFRHNALVIDNLTNLATDIAIWRDAP